MTPEQANALFETLIGRQIVVVPKTGGQVAPNPSGTVVKTAVEGIWELRAMGPDPLQPPQSGAVRQLSAKVSADDILFVVELGDLSAVSPAAISRPQPGGLFKP
jgi:hypothetical protein